MLEYKRFECNTTYRPEKDSYLEMIPPTLNHNLRRDITVSPQSKYPERLALPTRNWTEAFHQHRAKKVPASDMEWINAGNEETSLFEFARLSLIRSNCSEFEWVESANVQSNNGCEALYGLYKCVCVYKKMQQLNLHGMSQIEWRSRVWPVWYVWMRGISPSSISFWPFLTCLNSWWIVVQPVFRLKYQAFNHHVHKRTAPIPVGSIRLIYIRQLVYAAYPATCLLIEFFFQEKKKRCSAPPVGKSSLNPTRPAWSFQTVLCSRTPARPLDFVTSLIWPRWWFNSAYAKHRWFSP